MGSSDVGGGNDAIDNPNTVIHAFNCDDSSSGDDDEGVSAGSDTVDSVPPTGDG